MHNRNMKQYFVAEPGVSPKGPYAEDMVKLAFVHGMYPPGTRVWWEGCIDWTPVESVFGKSRPNAVPPSPPPSFASVPHCTPSPPVVPPAGWNVINAFTSNMKRYACFEGRSCKSEYWYFLLAQFILGVLSLCFGEEGFLVAYILMTLAFFVPNMAIYYRRLQDAGYNGTAAAVINGILEFLGLFTILATEFLVLDLLSMIFIIVLGCMPTKNVNNPYGGTSLRPI